MADVPEAVVVIRNFIRYLKLVYDVAGVPFSSITLSTSRDIT